MKICHNEYMHTIKPMLQKKVATVLMGQVITLVNKYQTSSVIQIILVALRLNSMLCKW